MSTSPPIILLAFANDREGNFLRSIAGEQQAISQALRESERKAYCEVLVLPDASVSDIIRTFKEERGRVAIFHYGGHADGDALHLSSEGGEETVIDGQSFADFLGHQEGLELVFLNGCATLKQKDYLLASGVERVIITERAINDDTAKQFAAQFYESLSTGASAKQAFEEAGSGTILLQGGHSRNLYWDKPLKPEETAVLPWQYHEVSPSLEEWKLVPSLKPSDIKKEKTSSFRWWYYVLGIILLGGAGYIGYKSFSPRPPVKPQVTDPKDPNETSKLPPWFADGDLVSFTGKVQDQDAKQVDEAIIEVENLKDLSYEASRQIDAHLGSFVLQLAPSQLGKNPQDSIRFIVSKSGFLKSVQWMGVQHLWESRRELKFLLLAENKSAGNPPRQNEVVIPTRTAEKIQRNEVQEAIKDLQLNPSLIRAPILEYNLETNPNIGTMALKTVELAVNMGPRGSSYRWEVTVNGKSVKAQKQGEYLLLKLLKSREAVVVEFRYRTICQKAKIVPDKNLRLNFKENFVNCR